MGESDVVIRVEGLGKKYSLRHEQSESYTALRDVVARQAKAAGRLLNPFTLGGQLRRAQRQAAQEHSSREEDFWALRDVSFEICRGERVGIIGRNGAGKSTLLKILSRITEPTTGRIEIRGRVASLLEVGTGFHPELTGRENIYLNGAILGMTRREIRSKFDEIVAFAGVNKFLDTPVKRYSSGMYVRLAFAVAAHLEPEILVVDEVLAVGDASFQKKCLGKMKDVSGEGRTVLFVSHNMPTLQSLCNHGLLLENGRLAANKPIDMVIRDYLVSNKDAKLAELFWGDKEVPGDKDLATLVGVAIRGDSGELRATFLQSEGINVHLKLMMHDPLCFSRMRVCLEIVSDAGLTLFASSDQETRQTIIAQPGIRNPGVIVSSCRIPGHLLKDGKYFLGVSAGIPGHKNLFHLDQLAIAFTVEKGSSSGSLITERWPGVIEPRLEWSFVLSSQ